MPLYERAKAVPEHSSLSRFPRIVSIEYACSEIQPSKVLSLVLAIPDCIQLKSELSSMTIRIVCHM